jgi:predicted transcriptional regulator
LVANQDSLWGFLKLSYYTVWSKPTWAGRAVQQGKLQTGELEAMVMDVLWDRGGWLTPGETHEIISARRTLAYTTVMTILVRLRQKGRLERQRDGRAYVYRPTETREEYVAARMQSLLTRVGDRPAALAHFVDALPRADRDQLRRVLKTGK